MIERDLESEIIAAVRGLKIEGLAVRGAWQCADAGAEKTLEDEAARAFCVVACKPRRFTAFGLCNASFDVSISVSVRADCAADGAALVEVLAPIAALITGWQMADMDGLLDLTISDAFYPGGVLVQGGEGPAFDEAAGAWMVSQSLTITGTITHNGGR